MSPSRQATITIANKSTVNSYSDGFSEGREPASAPELLQRQIATLNSFLWVFDITLDLGTDYDQDGHYSDFSLSLDLDTTLTSTSVYAVLYLAADGGPWNEYAVTGNFTISGRGSADTFSLQAELDRGYPSGYYDHYIEIYDAHSHELIGTYGPADSHLFAGLPVEGRSNDTFLNNTVVSFGADVGFGNNVNLSIAGTGALSPGAFVLLTFFLLARRRRNRL